MIPEQAFWGSTEPRRQATPPAGGSSGPFGSASCQRALFSSGVHFPLLTSRRLPLHRLQGRYLCEVISSRPVPAVDVDGMRLGITGWERPPWLARENNWLSQGPPWAWESTLR